MNGNENTQETVTGTLDTANNRAFLRVHGYLPGREDVPVPQGLVREHRLRRGDTVAATLGAGATLATVETVNGRQPGYRRPAFAELTPIYPNQRLTLETEPHALTSRAVDLLMPVGKGQRALIVAPPKAGKTTVLQAVAHGISKNHPECQLMIVLVGERPEEVTDFIRAVPGEVIAATFDQPPHAHTALAELAIERAKRLVEMGRDVVVLLDSLTRLGRAYSLAAPASGRVLSGGIDSGALLPPKRFLGAARAIENGGSLTVLATALVDTGSAGDNLFFEEYKGTSNAELKLDRSVANRRVFPAIDVSQTSTRREDLLVAAEDLVATQALRRALAGRDQQAIDVLVNGLRGTQTNAEFLARLTRKR
jgi:transcription termination factor Rho